MTDPFEDDGITIIRGSTADINRYPSSLARHFIKNILGLNPASTFISDESSLDHFMIESDDVSREIFLLYGVDVSDLGEAALLVDIFERIARDGIMPPALYQQD